MAAWVETSLVLADFGADAAKYRGYVEAGQGERQISPFERAVAGLVLGGEAFVKRVMDLLEGREASAEEPALRELRRQAKADPQLVEKLVEQVFGSERPARKRRLLLYAQRLHSTLRPSEIARRYGRTPAAVTAATRAMETEATKNQALAAGLASLAALIAAEK